MLCYMTRTSQSGNPASCGGKLLLYYQHLYYYFVQSAYYC